MTSFPREHAFDLWAEWPDGTEHKHRVHISFGEVTPLEREAGWDLDDIEPPPPTDEIEAALYEEAAWQASKALQAWREAHEDGP